MLSFKEKQAVPPAHKINSMYSSPSVAVEVEEFNGNYFEQSTIVLG